MAKQQCVILFADLADSVKLYSSLGDEVAKTHVLELQRQLGDQVISFGGKVREIIGDELMVQFDDPDSALACSISLHQKAKAYSEQQSIRLKLRIGMHLGTVVEEVTANRLFGDTINMAARMTGIAQADQSILTEALVRTTSVTWQDSVRQFDVTTVKGKSEPILVYDLPWLHDDLTTIMKANTHQRPSDESPQLLIIHHGKQYRLTNHEGVFSIGRAITNDLVIDADPVSRRHVTIERIHNHFVLSDQSTNGTHLFTNQGETLYLRRQQWPMSGSGELALGASREHGVDHIVDFRCGST